MTYNRGEDLNTGNPLPRMSPLRFNTSLSYDITPVSLQADMQAATIQDRLTGVQGVASARLEHAEDRGYISFDPEYVTLPDLVRIIGQLGYEASIPADLDDGESEND